MTSTLLLSELWSSGVQISLQDGQVKLDAPQSRLTADLVSRIRESKSQLIKMLSPCRHCGAKLILGVAPTWYQVRCPVEPCHFLIEEHKENLGASIRAEKERAA